MDQSSGDPSRLLKMIYGVMESEIRPLSRVLKNDAFHFDWEADQVPQFGG